MKPSEDMPPRAVTPAVEETERRAWYPLVLIFASVALGIFAGGAFSYRQYERHFRIRIEQELSAVAELKAAQIVQWRHERLVDANLLRGTPYVARRALAVLTQPKTPATRRIFTGWLDSLFSGAPYEQALLLDERLNVRLVYPEGAPKALSEAALRAAQQSSRSRRVVVADLHRETEDGPVYLSLMVPLVLQRQSDEDKVPAAGTDSSPADRGAGLLVLQINARKEFYPMIQRWPTASRTAETLLVRRDGNDALFLNDLRFRTNTALKLRIPLERTSSPAVKAALGQEGVIEGTDYRGVPVVAALRAIPDSPWALVACMDTAEVYAPLRERLWMTVLLMGALLLGAGAGVGLLWRQQRIRFYREKAAAAEALRASQQLIEGILNAMPVRVFWKDRNLVFLGCNAALARDAGFAGPKDLIGKDDYQMVWREQAELYRADDRRVIESGCPKLLIEEPQTTPDGNTLTLLSSKIPLRGPNGEVNGVLGMYMDITARKQTEAERDRLIRELQEALANVKSLTGLLPICAGCKKIRDDNGYWNQVESYIQTHSEARFTHGLCPDCIKEHYPDLEEADRQSQ